MSQDSVIDVRDSLAVSQKLQSRDSARENQLSPFQVTLSARSGGSGALAFPAEEFQEIQQQSAELSLPSLALNYSVSVPSNDQSSSQMYPESVVDAPSQLAVSAPENLSVGLSIPSRDS
jgi:hypothetical protein